MSRSYRKRRKSLPWGLFATGLVLVGGFSAANFLRASPGTQVGGDGCDPRWRGPTTTVVVDASNNLAPRSQASLRELISRTLSGRRGSRVVIARISGADAYQPEFLFSRCDPGGADEARFGEGPVGRDDERKTMFLEPMEAALTRLFTAVPSNGNSFIAANLQRIASDPAMHLDAPGSTLVFASDMIESSRVSKPYVTGEIVLPAVEEPFLSGIAVRVLELPAIPGATILQNHESRDRWRTWLTRAGARDILLSFPGLRS